MGASLHLPEYIRFETNEEFLNFILSLEEDVIMTFDEFQRFLRIDPLEGWNSFISPFREIAKEPLYLKDRLLKIPIPL